MIDVSENTQAILLLVAPLVGAGRSARTEIKPLTPGKYRDLAIWLRQQKCEPRDLLRSDSAAILDTLPPALDREHLKRLLGRGLQLGDVLSYWADRSIWVISRADDVYPQRLKQKLGYRSPALLYGCGDSSLLNQGGLAVVGSRNIDNTLLHYASSAGALAAEARSCLVSGGARGVDQAAMQGALQAGGQVIGILAHSLEKAALDRGHRQALMDHALLLCSPFDPAARFQAWQAMDRNKLIYAMADAALVVQAEVEKGGTWSGAKEQLQKLSCVPIYTRTSGPPSPGLEALRELGAHPWPEPDTADDFQNVMAGDRSTDEAPGNFLSDAREQMPPVPSAVSRPVPAQFKDLFAVVEEIMPRLLERPLSEKEIAQCLKITSYQARSWLKPLMAEQKIEKLSRPARYQYKPASVPEQPGALFALVKEIVLDLLEKPLSEQEIARHLDIMPAQAGLWLQRLVAEQAIEQISSPTRYRRKNWAGDLFAAMEGIVLDLLEKPLSAQEVAQHLDVTPGQARLWLRQLAAERKIDKSGRPVHYQRRPDQTTLLFSQRS